MIEATELIDVIPGATDADADEIERLELGAVEYCQRQSGGRYFGEPTTATFVRKGTGSDRLWLPERIRGGAAAMPATLIERAYEGADETTITATATDGYVYREEGTEGWLIRKGGYFWVRGFEYEFAMPYGYATGEEPQDVRDVVKALVIARFTLQAQGAGVIRSETQGRVTRTIGSDPLALVPGMRETLLSWRGGRSVRR